MFVVPNLPPPAYEMQLAAVPAPATDFIVASTAAHLKTIVRCPAHQHYVKGVCTPYMEGMMMSRGQSKGGMAPAAKT